MDEKGKIVAGPTATQMRQRVLAQLAQTNGKGNHDAVPEPQKEQR